MIDKQLAVPINDKHEVSCYVAALGHGIGTLLVDFPRNLRLMSQT